MSNFRKAITVLFTISFLSFGITNSASAAIGDEICDLSGAGTKASPYLVGSAADLAEVNDCFAPSYSALEDYKYFKQTADIDLAPNGEAWNSFENGWTPIGSIYDAFKGHYDGSGFKVSNLFIYSENGYKGLFGRVRDSVIKNVTLESDPETTSISSTLNSDYKYNWGALAGEASSSNFSNIHSNLNIASSNTQTGGLFGGIYNSNVKNVSSSGTITTIGDNVSYVNAIGGIAGELSYGVIENAEFTGSVSAANFATNSDVIVSQNIGGIAGNVYNATLINVKNTGQINGFGSVGGVVGYGDSAHIRKAENSGEVIAGNATTPTQQASEQTGGLASYLGFNSSISDSINTGNITVQETNNQYSSNMNIGGAVGQIHENVLVERVSVEANIDASNSLSIGGLVGASESNGGSIRNSSFKGQIQSSREGETRLGGVIGYVGEQLDIQYVFIDADIQAPRATQVGGFVGHVTSGDVALEISDTAVVGSLSALDEIGGAIGFNDNARHVNIERSYTAMTITTDDAQNKTIDAFVNGIWSAHSDSNFFIEQGLTSANSMSGTSEADLRKKVTFESQGWSFEGPSVHWEIDSNSNDGFPYLVFEGTQEQAATGFVTSSQRMLLTITNELDGKRQFTLNLSTKFAGKKATVYLVRDGKLVRKVFKVRLNKLGNRVAVKQIQLMTGDVLTLKVGSKRLDKVTI